MAFAKTLPVSEAGGKPLSNGGPPEARLGSQGARPIVWAVAHVGRKRVGKWGTWCAEVGQMLPGDCPPIFGMSSRNGIFQPVFFDRVDYCRIVGDCAATIAHRKSRGRGKLFAEYLGQDLVDAATSGTRHTRFYSCT